MPTSDNTKTCTLCGKPVGTDHYAGNPSRHCECHKKDICKKRALNADYFRAYDRARGNRQVADYGKRYREANPEKYVAQTAVGNAIRDGKLEKPEWCEMCLKICSVNAHHQDYSKPLDVWWLCPPCHKRLHVLLDRESRTGSHVRSVAALAIPF